MKKMGGIGKRMKYMIKDLWNEKRIEVIIVLLEIWEIELIKKRYMEKKLLREEIKVVFGGEIVMEEGILIGRE